MTEKKQGKSGRPRRGASVRVRVTRSFSAELIQALEDIAGDNQSEFMESWLWHHPQMREWKRRIDAGKAIVSWAKQEYQPISTADDERAAMERAGILQGMRVDLINLEPLDDMWKARLAIAGGRFDIMVTFWLSEDQLQVEDVQEV